MALFEELLRESISSPPKAAAPKTPLINMGVPLSISTKSSTPAAKITPPSKPIDLKIPTQSKQKFSLDKWLQDNFSLDNTIEGFRQQIEDRRLANQITDYLKNSNKTAEGDLKKLITGQDLKRPLSEQEQFVLDYHKTQLEQVGNMALGATMPIDDLGAQAIKAIEAKFGRSLIAAEKEHVFNFLKTERSKGNAMVGVTSEGPIFQRMLNEVEKKIPSELSMSASRPAEAKMGQVTIPTQVIKTPKGIEIIQAQPKSTGQDGLFQSLVEKTKPQVSLVEEAKKYKSAEEFVKAQNLFHGTPNEVKNGELTYGMKKGQDSGGIFLTDNPTIANVFTFGKGELYYATPEIKNSVIDLTKPSGVKQIENYIGKTYKTFEGETLKFTRQDFEMMFPDGKTDFASISQYPEVVQHFVIYLNKKGIAFDEYAGGEVGKTYQILEGNIPVKTKSQLTDIWNKAQETQKPKPEDDFVPWLEDTAKKPEINPTDETKLSEIEIWQQQELEAVKKEMADSGAFDFQGQLQANYERFVDIVKNPKLLNPRSKEIIQSGDVAAFKNIAQNVDEYNALKEDIFGYSDKNDDEMFQLFRERLVKENPQLLAQSYAGRAPSAPARIKVALGRQKRIKDLKDLAEKMVKRATIKEVPIKKLIKPEPATRITKKEPTLLKERLKSQAFGARKGVVAGERVGIAQQKNKQYNKIETFKREADAKLLKEGMKMRAAKDKIIIQLQDSASDARQIKADIVSEITAAFPMSERGKFINMVKNAETRKDLVKAYLRINGAEQEYKLKTAISDLKKTVDKLSDSTSISADYRNKIKEIVGQYELSGHNEATLDRLKATQQFLDSSKATGLEIDIPQRILEKLKILTRIPKDQLTLNQVEGLKAEVELLGKLGETKWSSKQALYEAEKEARMNALLESATPINSKVLPQGPIGSSPKKWAKNFIDARNYIQKSRVGLTSMDGMAEITGVEPMKKALDLSFGNYLTFNDRVLPQWYELTKSFDENNFKRIGTYAIAQQEGGVERLANSGVTEQEISNLKLTPEEEKAYQFALESFDSNFPAVKKYALDVYNADVGKQKNYVSFMSDYSAMSDLEIYDRFGQRAEDVIGKRTKTVEQGFTKERAKGNTAQLETNIDKIFRRHMDDVAYMLTMGRDIKQYFEIINSPEMREKLGDVGTMAWLQWLDLMARKGGVEGGQRIAALDVLRQNMSMGVLAFRATSALAQFTTLADTAGTIGVGYTMRGATKIATSKEWRNFVMDNFPEVRKAVGDDMAFREFTDDWRAKVAGVGFKPLQALDGTMRSTAAAGSYMKFADEAGIPIDLTNPNKELIQKATAEMRKSQGSSFFKDQPLAITAGYGITNNRSLNKTLFTFQSFMLNHWDNIQRQTWRQGIKEGNYKKAGLSFFWLVLVAAALEEGIRRGTNKLMALATGDETESKPFLENTTHNILQSVPIFGSIMSSMEYSSNPVPVINTSEQLIKGLDSIKSGKKTETKIKGLIRSLGAGATLLGVPGSSQLAQIINKVAYPNQEKTTTIPSSSSASGGTSSRANPFKASNSSRENPFKSSSNKRANPFK